eukprot:2837062-Amphidinium_carterae.1
MAAKEHLVKDRTVALNNLWPSHRPTNGERDDESYPLALAFVALAVTALMRRLQAAISTLAKCLWPRWSSSSRSA